MATRRGQAMTELAVGMFLLALIVCSLITFAEYELKELREARTYRVQHTTHFKVNL